ncbi:MAG: CDP-glycerol--poly(glycerophosphate) glycerophosphotransferase, partial [Gammaproteobacteria bacterium]|nr:CDP-glycerol--poly(glycerophosphate) glycerophosphotransferase [Gammaproteobacteria bacterium]
MRVLFDVEHLYYLPQFLPLYNELCGSGCDCSFIFYSNADTEPQLNRILKSEDLPYRLVNDAKAALSIYRHMSPDWIVFGNNYEYLDALPAATSTALLY